MKRILCAGLIALMAMGGTAEGRTDRNHVRDHRRVMECHNIDWQQGPGKVRELVACVAQVWGAPGGAAEALSVSSCETGGSFNPKAYNPNGHAGLFQHDVDAWPGRWAYYLRPLGFNRTRWQNAELNAIAAVRMAKADGTWAYQWSCA